MYDAIFVINLQRSNTVYNDYEEGPTACLMFVFLVSVGYTMDTMYFNWLDNAVEIDKNLELPQFKMVKHVKYDCSQNYTAGLI